MAPTLRPRKRKDGILPRFPFSEQVYDCLELSTFYLQHVVWEDLVRFSQTSKFGRLAAQREMKRRIELVLAPWFPSYAEVEGFLSCLREHNAVVVGGVVRELLGINKTSWYEPTATGQAALNLNICATRFGWHGVMSWLERNTQFDTFRTRSIPWAFLSNVTACMTASVRTDRVDYTVRTNLLERLRLLTPASQTSSQSLRQTPALWMPVSTRHSARRRS